MKCIICGKEAEYLYLGNSYCEEHKNEHKSRVESLIKKAEKKAKSTKG